MYSNSFASIWDKMTGVSAIIIVLLLIMIIVLMVLVYFKLDTLVKKQSNNSMFDTPQSDMKIYCQVCGTQYSAYESACPNCQTPKQY